MRLRSERGMTLIEMLVAMVVFLVVLAGAMSAVGAQSRGFSRGTEEMGLLQNLRYGVQLMHQEFRMAGANVPDRQAPVVYASETVFSFNADLVSNLAGDISAVYIDPNAPAGQVLAWPLGQAAPIPGSSPSFVWPQADFGTSPAETLTFRFAPDAETARGDDFVLLRQVNDQAPEVVVRNILAPAGGEPFLRYHHVQSPAAGALTLEVVPTAWLPLRHSAPLHSQLPDTGVVARIDNLRAVEVRYRVTNGQVGAGERTRAVHTMIALPNMGIRKLQSCGASPIFGQAVLAAAIDVAGVPQVEVSWGAAVDELAGEEDIIRYVIWRRVGLGSDWGDPIASIPSGASPYLYSDGDVESGRDYQYAIAAQDCTPALSTRNSSGWVTIP